MHRPRRKSRRRSPWRWLWLLPVALLLAALGYGAWYVTRELPYRAAESYMPEDAGLTIRQKPGGSLQLSWQPAERTDFYCIEILRPLEEGQEVQESIFRGYAYDPSGYPLPGLPEDTELVLRVSTVMEYESAGKLERRQCDNPAEAQLKFNAPAITNLQWVADPDNGVVDISFRFKDANHCRIYVAEENGSQTLLKTVTEENTRITFGKDGDLPAIARGQSCTLFFDACYLTEELEFYGIQCGSLTVEREDLLGRALDPVLTDEGNNVCSITWNETKGEYYEVQQLDHARQKWVTVATVPGDGERSYTTGHLENLSNFRFRVVAVGGDTLPNERYAAISSEMDFETGMTPIYCTIWPVKDMDAFDAPEGGTVVSSVAQAKAYCVIDAVGDMLGVSIDGQTCYIDGNYCMINLAEYLDELCTYDITNSYSSIYMVHEFAIPEVTDTVIDGYGAVAVGNGQYLVPLLYPTAKKIFVAAQDALSRGYRLKIYDAFRPNRATQKIYELAELILDEPIPEEPFNGKMPEKMPEPVEGETLTYRKLMTNDEWSLSNFLAQGRSMHNYGVAVDLTLEDMYSGKELKMQTSMHDLSHYSVLKENNKQAKLLAQIMKAAGLGDLRSEWWHFQDNEAKQTLDLPSVWKGVNCECWMADDNGWRFRNRNGSYIKDTTQTIGGVSYVFDSNGYATVASESTSED